MSKKVLGIIPARYASSRFPGKPLALIDNKPMIQHVYERASLIVDDILVATDDERIMDAVKLFKGNVLMTRPDHQSGTDRCIEALQKWEEKQEKSYDIVINIQGDEPTLQPEQLLELISCFDGDNTFIATLIKEVSNPGEIENSNIVKVVFDERNYALYFSRAAIPFVRENNQQSQPIFHKHVGIYAFDKATLLELEKVPTSALEQAESLEQLRWMEKGYLIRIKKTKFDNIGVDTPEDLEQIIQS